MKKYQIAQTNSRFLNHWKERRICFLEKLGFYSRSLRKLKLTKTTVQVYAKIAKRVILTMKLFSSFSRKHVIVEQIDARIMFVSAKFRMIANAAENASVKTASVAR